MSETANKEKQNWIRQGWSDFKKIFSSDGDKKKKRKWLVLIICIVIVALFILYRQVLEFHHYQAVASTENNASEAIDYASFGNLIIRYGNDGASAIATDNTTVWEETFEMENPIISVRNNYFAIADQKGKTIVIMNRDGFCQQISTDLPIQKIDVSDIGSVAVLMQDEGSISYLGLYSLSGKKTAEGTLHFGNSGYPLALAISEDGVNLALSVLDIKDGQSKSSVNFYNFAHAPAEGKDNQVASFSYDNTVIPEISYGTGTKLVAFGDDKIISFQGGADPQEKNVLELEGTVRSIVHNEDRIGLLYDQGDDGDGSTLVLYDYDGSEKQHYSINGLYTNVGLLENGEVYLVQEKNLAIYRKYGRIKFTGSADTPFYTIMSQGKGMHYVFVREGKTEQVRLSLF
ncbi:MAG: hypothetical protein IJV59_07610 [Eubacterium sp.]|nr:hypothetical protein [Eubacterium sp.]